MNPHYGSNSRHTEKVRHTILRQGQALWRRWLCLRISGWRWNELPFSRKALLVQIQVRMEIPPHLKYPETLNRPLHQVRPPLNALRSVHDNQTVITSNEFNTRDINLASALALNGAKLVDTVVFWRNFEFTLELPKWQEDMIHRYYAGLLRVDPNAYCNYRNYLKSVCFGKMNKKPSQEEMDD